MTTTIEQPQALAIVPQHETAISSAVAQSTASIQARYTIALARPRNLDQVRVEVLKDCKRPAFAQIAMYNKPVGQGIKGLSIRFVESAMRHMRNVLVESPTLYDDEQKRILRVSVTDLEANTVYMRDVTINKTVERSSLKGGQKPISARTNSYGKTVYLVQATDDEILNKEAALVSKAVRTLGLRILPADLIDEATDTIEATVRNGAAEDPDASRRKLVDAFGALGVHPSDLVTYLRHGLDKCTPDEIAHLRMAYQTLKDGEATWLDYVEAKDDDAPKEGKTSRTREMLKRRKSKLEPKTAPVDDIYDYGPPPMSDEELAILEASQK